jgi:hypothetical protein
MLVLMTAHLIGLKDEQCPIKKLFVVMTFFM